jgi:hypothetical protein
MMKEQKMKLIAENGVETRELGADFTFESAYKFIFENDSDPVENPWLPGFDLILVGADGRWVLEADAWSPVD